MAATKSKASTKASTTAGSLVLDYVKYYKAILARTLFGTHALVTVWRTTVIMGVAYWALAFGVFLLSVEYVVTMWVRAGQEWPWVSPSTLCYLATTASALWVQKLESLGHLTGQNGSNVASVPGVGMQLDFSAGDWLLLTEQTMMVTIILSRWLLPKGDMAHTQLSSLLLLYLGLSADILDFSTIFSEPKIAADKTICYVILLVWTGSLCQFFLVLTSTSKNNADEVKTSLRSIVCSSEVWQILVQVGLQDFPFLLIRVLALLQYEVFTYTIIFFVCKNSLIISLEIYHMVAVCKQQHKKLKRRRVRVAELKSKFTNVAGAVGAMNKRRLAGLFTGAKGGDGLSSATADDPKATASVQEVRSKIDSGEKPTGGNNSGDSLSVSTAEPNRKVVSPNTSRIAGVFAKISGKNLSSAAKSGAIEKTQTIKSLGNVSTKSDTDSGIVENEDTATSSPTTVCIGDQNIFGDENVSESQEKVDLHSKKSLPNTGNSLALLNNLKRANKAGWFAEARRGTPPLSHTLATVHSPSADTREKVFTTATASPFAVKENIF
ncbi:uncharacterized protein LOC101846352 [Aplysia californica]|uniref:Uncharacterized protein LOC101846352 n=1 Tax=Aplysia californica TaxID=6500 RepID=A0ABM1A0D0_APLCA|nr:uncharacterized protein LOC101846352 [Aplysia californica]